MMLTWEPKIRATEAITTGYNYYHTFVFTTKEYGLGDMTIGQDFCSEQLWGDGSLLDAFHEQLKADELDHGEYTGVLCSYTATRVETHEQNRQDDKWVTRIRKHFLTSTLTVIAHTPADALQFKLRYSEFLANNCKLVSA